MNGFGKILLIVGWVKIDFLPEKASTKFNKTLGRAQDPRANGAWLTV